MAESKLAGNFANNNQLQRVRCGACVQYAKPWPHSDIKSCSRRSTHVFTPGMILLYLAAPFLTKGVFA